MNKSKKAVVALFLFIATQAIDVSAYAKTDPNKFKNCTELKKVYPKGVAKDAKSAQQSGATLNLKVYVANKSSDRDKDGSACES
jgi:hypothetical protein